MKNKIILLLFIITIPVLSFSQEKVVGLSTNPVIKSYLKQNKKLKGTKSTNNTMLSIPFFDDFAGNSIFPNDSLWADKNVFINSFYPVMPPTIGVATFDELNDSGAIYSTSTPNSFIADYLTSNPIRLDSVFGSGPAALTIGDSIYFSFFYQPQGIGDTVGLGAPETIDSLVLEFYSPKTMTWKEVWADTGSTLQQFHNRYHSWFKQVMIPITDTADYFHPGFRFRFYNWANLPNTIIADWPEGNANIWNLDYVYLDMNRNKNDTAYKDVAFVYSTPSVLKNYCSMPWSQYKVDTTAELKDTFQLYIRNLYSANLNINYKYNVFDEFGNILLPGTDPNTQPTFPYPGTYSGNNILAFSVNQFSYGPPTNIDLSKPPVDFTFTPTVSDSAKFTIVNIIKVSSGNLYNESDSIIYVQKFYNYYAYDNGVPEAGYMLSSNDPSPYADLAYQFKLNRPDTLRAVDMFFTQGLNPGQQFFNLTIWNDDNGYPGDTLFTIQNLQPFFGDSINEYMRILISRILPVSGTFYVGWEQPTEENITVGFDLTNNEENRIFYNIDDGNGWYNGEYPGALMIRPVVGRTLPLGINERSQAKNEIKVFPNPSTGNNVSIDIPALMGQDVSKMSIHLYDMIGNEVYSSQFTNKINVSGLQNGMYLLYISSNNVSNRYVTKLTIIK